MNALTAAIVTVGSELTEGLRVDTNTAEIARALGTAGVRVREAVSVPDDQGVLAQVLDRVTSQYDVVVTTGGLGPTHDDVTRDAAAEALGLPQVFEERLATALAPALARHTDPAAADLVLSQALVLEGAEVIDPVTGTAPGQIARTPVGILALLPGPPTEMRPMLEVLLGTLDGNRATPSELGIVGMSESDVQVRVQRAVEGIDGVGFTVLARPGDVRAIFIDEGGGASALASAAQAAASALGDACYGTGSSTLAEVVVRAAIDRDVTLALAESCTGGLLASALTDVAGSSAALLGSIVSYANSAKVDLLGVKQGTLDTHGAVSAQTVAEMATGALDALGAKLAISVSGIAGPDGGTPDKPVGTVWFGVASQEQLGAPSVQIRREFPGGRAAVRQRATAFALDLLRRAILGLSLEG